MSASIEQAVLETEAGAKMGEFIKKVGVESDPRFGAITTLGIQRRANGPWYTVDVNMIEMLQILQTGEFDEDKVTAVAVCEVNLESGEKVQFIYDFIALHTERNPWRML